jgi:hypothetical protein
MLVHPQAFLDVTLREGARWYTRSAGSGAESLDGLRGETEAEGLAHVSQRSAARY